MKIQLAKMQAICEHCNQLVPAEYIATETNVSLWRRCELHGPHSREVSNDPDYFSLCLDMARQKGNTYPGVIVELLDGCNMRCPTCIAGSGPELDNKRDAATIGKQLRSLAAAGQLPAVLLSGGEPTIHPEIRKFMTEVEESRTPRRVLITNGVLIASGVEFVRSLFVGRPPWEVFLQYDSRRSLVLQELRGEDLRQVRRRALQNLGEMGVATTLVCVIKMGMNDDEIGELIEFAISQPHVVGIQFQPMKAAGRTDNFILAQRGDATVVRTAVNRYAGGQVVKPHPKSPLSVGLARFDRLNGTWSEEVVSGIASEYFIEPTHEPDGALRVSVMEYSDLQDWTSLRSLNPPYVVLQPNGGTRSVDDYFLSEEVVELQRR